MHRWHLLPRGSPSARHAKLRNDVLGGHGQPVSSMRLGQSLGVRPTVAREGLAPSVFTVLFPCVDVVAIKSEFNSAKGASI